MVTLEAILGYDNIKSAALAVRRNKGAAGVDGMQPSELIKCFMTIRTCCQSPLGTVNTNRNQSKEYISQNQTVRKDLLEYQQW